MTVINYRILDCRGQLLMKKISLRGKQFAVTKISVHQHDLQPIAVIYLLPGKLLDPSQTNRTPTTKSTLPIKA